MPAYSVPNKDSVTSDTILRCVEVYKKVLSLVYDAKIKKDKIKSALDDDEWRYTQLPSRVRDRPKAEGLSKNELARLVQWKITHGIHRPFLPGMIQKNAAEDVLSHTTDALKLLTQGKSPTKQTIKSALDAVCKLKGVGPATGTLVLSVFNPVSVPFFQDELFHWLFPDHAGKLKYDAKEYAQMANEADAVMKRTGVSAWQLEQAAFVLQHLDVLDETTRASLLSGTDKNAEAMPRTLQDKEDTSSKSKNNLKTREKEEAASKPALKLEGEKIPRKAQDEGTNASRRAKRVKK